ncbi:tetratricopeptide (TPR) repeat protein [Parabacteroides sp. PFB2-12]|uniref:tetratricopeptide repeat protein n=1 Tax=unclassified Parabacteroides TaxID=2649774 RepID=UPI002476899E|nr:MULTISPECIES: hypothetical protein [unclassified Parabacteroides]MDH6341830.1 tetratricopeptide (TPR) repeat protein [Parabacteroides sp. PM6-13]MDH6391631.1 tetratricopeptide (TPR) repeat protein [Parabacteroides sp. PFB2-12]
MKKLLLLFCCFTLTGAAQEISLQELVGQRKYKEVLEQAETLSATDSTYTNLQAIGQAYEGLLRYPEAYRHYSMCLQMDTTNVDMRNTLGRMAVNMGRAKDAEHYFNSVLQVDTANFYANYQIARLHQQLGEYEAAIEKYEFLLMNDETNPVLLRSMGDCYTQMGDLQPAEACYHLAYQYNKENASLASALINTMLRIGGESAHFALTVCDTALYYNPNNRQLERNKAMTLYMNKLYPEADSLYTQLLVEGDSTFLTLKYAGVSRYYAGQFMNAIEPLQEAYAADTTQIDVCLLLGSSLGKTYDRKMGHAFLDKAEKNMEALPIYVRQLLKFRAETFRKDGNIAESDRLYYKAWQEEPENIALLSHLSGINVSRIEYYQSDVSRKKGLFARVLYVREALKVADQYKPSFFHYHRYFFESLYNDMFFRSVSEEPMLSPDGKKSTLHLIDLRQLINELPEMPDKDKERMDSNFEQHKEMQKVLEKEKKEQKEKKS